MVCVSQTVSCDMKFVLFAPLFCWIRNDMYRVSLYNDFSDRVSNPEMYDIFSFLNMTLKCTSPVLGFGIGNFSLETGDF